ncbi:MAG: NAD(P)/FAD-dependent oxidoreductase [Anaerolineales bacterium]|nr:NAD(P)/FAD-dependent oxidoreductase [Anaerolineales bacterium]MCW5855083.1 NAD(P)/FAD-dependent oxidoreductase [Anaerolineales bacterium]
MSRSVDVIVIGGGHNGLSAAAWLAKTGRRVLLLEARPSLGGAAATEELFPGFHFNTGAPDAGLFHPGLAGELGLHKHGLEFIENDVAAFAPLADGRGLTLWRDAERSAMEIAAFSADDARAFLPFYQRTQRFAAVLGKMAALQPFALKANSLKVLAGWGRLALSLRGLGGRDMMEFLRVLPMSAAQYLNEHFETEALKGLLAYPSTIGLMQGPRASGTAFMMLYQQMGQANSGYRSSLLPRGGVGRLSAALAATAQAHGAELRTSAPVATILCEDGRAVGVRLGDGEEIRAKIVLSSADPRRTFLGLVGGPQLTPRFSRRLRSLKLRGSTASVHLALSGLPDFPAAAGDANRLKGAIVISPSLDYAEQAYDDAKHGRSAGRPVLEARIPSLLDPSLAPSGQHTLSVLVRYAPYKLAQGDWESEGGRLGDLAVETLAQHAPNLKAQITQQAVITPLDYERTYGLTEGSEMHGQMGLDQLLLMRPTPGFIGYRSPIEGLYVCGAGGHPGGGLTGLPGWLAAGQAAREMSG